VTFMETDNVLPLSVAVPGLRTFCPEKVMLLPLADQVPSSRVLTLLTGGVGHVKWASSSSV